MTPTRLSALFFCVAALTACQPSYENQMDRLEKDVRNNRIGQSGDVWMIKLNAFAEYEKVALFFGYWDDWSACSEMATMYMQRYPSDTYSCGFAN